MYELEVARLDFKLEGAEAEVEEIDDAGVAFDRNFLFTLTAVNFLTGWLELIENEIGGVAVEFGGGREGDGTGEGALMEGGPEAVSDAAEVSLGGSEMVGRGADSAEVAGGRRKSSLDEVGAVEGGGGASCGGGAEDEGRESKGVAVDGSDR